MQQVTLMPQHSRLALTEAHIDRMREHWPFDLTLNVKTFHIFVFYGLMNPEMYQRIDEDNFEPWRLEANWDQWGISVLFDYQRYEAYSYYELHRDLCLRHQHYKVRLHPTMGLGLFVTSPDVKYEHILLTDPKGNDPGLFGFIEYLPKSLFQYFNKEKHPSLYQDPEGNQGILYGPLYFCNHQSWAPEFESLYQHCRSHQVLVRSTETIIVDVVDIEAYIKYVSSIFNNNNKRKCRYDSNNVELL